MKVENVKAGLEKLLPVLETWEATKVSKDFQKLVELMDGYEDMTIDAFCKKAREGLEGRKKTTGGASALRNEIVSSHVASLKKATAKEISTLKRRIANLNTRLQKLPKTQPAGN